MLNEFLVCSPQNIGLLVTFPPWHLIFFFPRPTLAWLLCFFIFVLFLCFLMFCFNGLFLTCINFMIKWIWTTRLLFSFSSFSFSYVDIDGKKIIWVIYFLSLCMKLKLLQRRTALPKRLYLLYFRHVSLSNQLMKILWLPSLSDSKSSTLPQENGL